MVPPLPGPLRVAVPRTVGKLKPKVQEYDGKTYSATFCLFVNETSAPLRLSWSVSNWSTAHEYGEVPSGGNIYSGALFET